MCGAGGGGGGDGVPDAEGVMRWRAAGEAAGPILFLAPLGALGAITGGARPSKPVGGGVLGRAGDDADRGDWAGCGDECWRCPGEVSEETANRA